MPDGDFTAPLDDQVDRKLDADQECGNEYGECDSELNHDEKRPNRVIFKQYF